MRLYERYFEARGKFHALHCYIASLFSQPADVNDLALETYRRLHQLDDETLAGDPLTRLHQIAADVLAKSGAGSAAVDPPSGYVPPAVPGLQATIDASLSQLAPEHVAMLLAHRRDGLSYDAIAQKTGVPEGVVQSTITKTKARIRMSVQTDARCEELGCEAR